jgi:hypothetical protein
MGEGEDGQLQGYELSIPFGYLLDGSQSRPGRWSYIPVPVWNRTSVFQSITSHFKNSFVLYYIKNQQDATLAVLFISNCNDTLHVSDAICVHPQEYLKTVVAASGV